MKLSSYTEIWRRYQLYHEWSCLKLLLLSLDAWQEGYVCEPDIHFAFQRKTVNTATTVFIIIVF
jgi:hypothetical protein